jgi:hypothetical protein
VSSIFDILILIGRPAAGKSEIIDYLQGLSAGDRRHRFHIGQMLEIDDFPFIWEWFRDDDFLSAAGAERLYTDEQYYFKNPVLWNLCIDKINRRYQRLLESTPRFHRWGTAIVEFARGGEHGFRDAFEHLSDDILSRGSVVYIDVSYEESARKNRRRARKGLEHTILYHSLPDEKMEFYYRVNDWHELASADEGWLAVRDHRLPYAVFHNEPEVTDKPDELGRVLQVCLRRLFEIRKQN